MHEEWDAIREESKSRRTRNRDRADIEFGPTEFLARSLGMKLTKCNGTQYQLRCDGWLLDIYPGNQRLYRAKPGGSHPKTVPYLNLPLMSVGVQGDWTLEDIIRAASTTRGQP